VGSNRNGPITPDLFAATSAQEPVSRLPKPTTSLRHVLPSNLPSAIKHLSDQELDQLLAAVIAEQVQRGKKPPAPEKTVSKRTEVPSVTLSIGKLNAVRAAYKVGATISKIAKQFGIPQSDVRKALEK
jgi:hypothetical protein